MADDINRVQIEFEVVDKTADGIAKVEDKATQSAENIGQAMDKKLGEGAASSARKVDNLARSVNKATSAKELAAQSLQRYTSMFNPFNLVMGVAIAGIAALAKGVYDLATGPQRELEKAVRDTSAALEQATKAINSYYEATLIAFAGMSQAQQLRRSQAIELNKLDMLRLDMERMMYQQAKTAQEQIGGNILEHYMNIRQGNKEYQELTLRIDEARKASEKLADVERLGAIRSATGGAAAGIAGAGGAKQKKATGARAADEGTGSMFGGIISGAVQNAMEEAEFMLTLQETTLAAIKGGEELQLQWEDEKTQSIIEMNRRMYEETLLMEQNATNIRAQNIRDFVTNTELVGDAIGSVVQTVGKVTAVAIKDEKKRMQATSAITAILESIAAAVELAKGLSTMLSNPAESATHFAGMAAHIVAAVLAAKYGGGGATAPSASRGSAGAGGGAFRPSGDDSGKTQTTIVVQGHIFSPEGGADFVRSAYEASENQRDPGRVRTEVR